MIVVKLPVKHAYVDSEESVNTLETLKLLKKVKAVGFDKDETDIDAVNKGLEEDKMVYAGAADDLKFRELVKNKIDFDNRFFKKFCREAKQQKMPKKSTAIPTARKTATVRIRRKQM